MATLGTTARPSGTEGWGLNVENQHARLLTMPAGGPWRITKVGIWVSGWNDTPIAKVMLWSPGGTWLRESAAFTVVNGGGLGAANLDLYEYDLTSVKDIDGGNQIYAGIHRQNDVGDDMQVGVNAGSTHVDDEHATIPDNINTAGTHTGSLATYIVYELANTVPNAPTIDEPDQNEVVEDTTPLIDWTHSDPDGDPQSGFQMQVDNSSLFISPEFDSGSVTSATTSDTCSTVLTRGTTYYARVRTRDASGSFGAWSSTRTFKIAALPVGTVTSPSGSVAAPLYYTAGTDTTPKLKPVWTFSCADGGTQTSASVKVYDSAGTTLLHTHAHVGSAVTAELSGYAPVNGTKYQISVTPVCSHGVTGSESAKKSCQVRWGRASYRADLGAAPSTLTTATSVSTNSGQVIMEYATSALSTPEPTDWKATISEATKLQWVWHRVTLLPAATASPVSPALNSVTFSYSASVSVPDSWTVAGGSTLDEGSYVYGTLSLKHTTNAAEQLTYQSVEVVPNTKYIFSARVKTQGNPVATLELREPGGTVLTSVAIPADNGDFVRYVTPVWDSGATTTIDVVARTNAAVGPVAWFDALKLEASIVVTPWTPGFLGQAVVLDAGGISVDAEKGGVFRLRSGNGIGGAELGEYGLNLKYIGLERYHSAVVAVGQFTGGMVRLPFNTQVLAAHGVSWAPSGGSDHVRIDEAGVYAININASSATAMTADKWGIGFVSASGVVPTASLATARDLAIQDNSNGGERLNATFVRWFNANDFVSAVAYQNSAASINLEANSMLMSIYRLGT